MLHAKRGIGTRGRAQHLKYGCAMLLVVGGGCTPAATDNDDGALDAGRLFEDASLVPDTNDPLPPLPPPNVLAGICVEHDVPPVTAAALRLTDTFDYVAVRQWADLRPVGVPPPEWTSTKFKTISEIGSQCAT